ncbi:MAG: hypothetical protein WCL51_16215 [Bacteroidota bacterium]
MSLQVFKKKVVDIFCENITDKVFLMIQNDRKLMYEYLKIIEENNSIANVNSQIAKEIKKRFSLENKDFKNVEPESFLIQSHEEFKVD